MEFACIKTIILDDDGGTRLAGIVVPTCDSPNLAALHLSSHSQEEKDSTKAMSSFSCGLRASARI